ncbi:FAD-dependent oxidoreductase [Nocardia sp. 2]|uniref:FAD-dependent oxidoreductase n=1 Tax=Nocardia acididurans TaxID=2802282 RepID=A0ABS1MBZ6_9NOCA|nr:FAD-dependent oxidoreductase [Nocardia acididurans]MBL1078177.1 FAD-dependent oxidoreductase [Nocardia acididurans]
MTERIVIVGAGVTGATAAQTLRKEGFEGSITLIGSEPIAPYRRPVVSKDLLAGTIALEKCLIDTESSWAAQDIALLTGTTVVAVEDGRVRLRTGEALAYDSLLLATGARANTLHPTPEARTHTLRGIEDIAALRDSILSTGSLLVIGAGLIGCEVAATARALGADVRILHAGTAPLERILPEAVSEVVRDLHAAHDVPIENDVLLSEIADDPGGTITATAIDGRTWTAGTVLVAIGSSPSDELARSAGLDVDNGILVDERYRTSRPGVFAAGDVANRFLPQLGQHERSEHWNSARYDGAAAAKSMLGQPAPDFETPWGWSSQYGVNIQFAGWMHPHDELVVQGSLPDRDFAALALRHGELVGAAAIGRPKELRTVRQTMESARPFPSVRR